MELIEEIEPPTMVFRDVQTVQLGFSGFPASSLVNLHGLLLEVRDHCLTLA